MTFHEYQQLFRTILENPNPAAPYDNEFYRKYTSLNENRMNRWIKTGNLLPELKELIGSIAFPMKWIVITEPWCGDAAHIVPFMELMAKENGLITLELQLRDSEPFLINEYLTNGGKAIPVIVIQDGNGNDLAVWGPRPKEAQELHARLKEESAEMEKLINELQLWYNNDKGQKIMNEFYGILKSIAS